MSFHRQGKVLTLKPHRCTGCLADIPVGSTVTYMAGAIGGDFCSTYLCDPCADFLDKHPHYFNDGIWYEGDIGEARREEERERGA